MGNENRDTLDTARLTIAHASDLQGLIDSMKFIICENDAVFLPCTSRVPRMEDALTAISVLDMFVGDMFIALEVDKDIDLADDQTPYRAVWLCQPLQDASFPIPALGATLKSNIEDYMGALSHWSYVHGNDVFSNICGMLNRYAKSYLHLMFSLQLQLFRAQVSARHCISGGMR